MENKINQIKELFSKPAEALDVVTNKVKGLPVTVIVAIAAMIAFLA